MAASQGQAAYLPAPPASLEAGPSSPAPGAGVFWTPGKLVLARHPLRLAPGFWAAVQPSWVWIPAHYVWTPGGYLFVEGYWDLPLASRGILFAPVYYAQPVYLQPAYVFSPSITIATSGLVANLFIQPSYHHYCFGDYYDRSFLSVGIFPWFSFTYSSGPAGPVYHDPLFTFYAASYVRQDPRWVARVREEYIVRRDNVSMRPPRTYIEQTRIVERNVSITRNVTVVENGRGRDAAHGPADPAAREPSGIRGGNAPRKGGRRGLALSGNGRASSLPSSARKGYGKRDSRRPGVPKGGRGSPPRPAARPVLAPWHSPRRPSRPPSINTRGPESRSDRGSSRSPHRRIRAGETARYAA